MKIYFNKLSKIRPGCIDRIGKTRLLKNHSKIIPIYDSPWPASNYYDWRDYRNSPDRLFQIFGSILMPYPPIWFHTQWGDHLALRDSQSPIDHVCARKNVDHILWWSWFVSITLQWWNFPKGRRYLCVCLVKKSSPKEHFAHPHHRNISSGFS